MSDAHLTQLEEALAHQTRQVEELSDLVAAQAKRIDILERRVRLLLERAAEAEVDKGGGAYFADERPPHY
jgi:SlyX protein